VELIPAIDIRGGKTVRLLHGDYQLETIYDLDPIEVVKGFVAAGASIIHVVDLDGAREGQPVNLDTIRAITHVSGAHIELGGGIRTLDHVHQALSLGVLRVVLGSVLLKDPSIARTAFREFGDRIVAGIDARGGVVATEGWLATSEMQATTLVKEMAAAGCQRFIVTDIATDGTLMGPNPKFVAEMIAATASPVIASGGIGTESDFDALIGLHPQPEGVIVGRAIYEEKIDLARCISRLRSLA